jgi:hypothetical protein
MSTCNEPSLETHLFFHRGYSSYPIRVQFFGEMAHERIKLALVMTG